MRAAAESLAIIAGTLGTLAAIGAAILAAPTIIGPAVIAAATLGTIAIAVWSTTRD